MHHFKLCDHLQHSNSTEAQTESEKPKTISVFFFKQIAITESHTLISLTYKIQQILYNNIHDYFSSNIIFSSQSIKQSRSSSEKTKIRKKHTRSLLKKCFF